MRSRFCTRSVSPRTSPSASESNTVVMPAAAICVSCAITADRLGHLHAGARREVLLHVVGVQLDQAGHEVVAVEVDGAGDVRAAVGDFGDAAVAHHDRAVELGIGGDDAGVGEDRLDAHASTPQSFRKGDVVDAGGQRIAHGGVVEDADDRRAGVAALVDQLDHAVAVGGIERGGGLVEQQDRDSRRSASARC